MPASSEFMISTNDSSNLCIGTIIGISSKIMVGLIEVRPNSGNSVNYTM